MATLEQPLVGGKCISPRPVDELPDLTENIKRLGVMEEYLAFKDRYLAWRTGRAIGARGEILHEHLIRPENTRVNQAGNRGFGYWFPTVQDWLWSRSISYWIAVTFFEGSIFFTISSFMYNQKDFLGDLYQPLTLYGYCAGKVCYFSCTYLMCLETINLRRDPDDAASTERQSEQPFYYWPFRYKTAIKNGKESGAGALPYFASVTYFIGVLAFGVGVIAEISGLPVSIASQVQLDTFLIGSLMFAAGGYIECLQNQTFTTLSLKTGWFGALFNFSGGLLFTAGAVVGWFDSYTSENLYGAGSLVYCIGSSLQIVMWKDEQFGLTFLTAINVSDKSAGAPAQNKDEEHRATFSALGAVFVHLWCFCGAMSVYNFNIELLRHYELNTWRSWQMAFNEFLPCLFAHMMLLLASAVMRTPTITPFREMHILVRVIGVLITANSTCTFFEFIFHDIRQ